MNFPSPDRQAPHSNLPGASDAGAPSRPTPPRHPSQSLLTLGVVDEKIDKLGSEVACLCLTEAG
jgi:hypothetical protein